MRHNRFKLSRLCSSDNYELSKRARKAELERSHERFAASGIEAEPVLVPTLKVFGARIRISREEAERLSPELVRWEEV